MAERRVSHPFHSMHISVCEQNSEVRPPNPSLRTQCVGVCIYCYLQCNTVCVHSQAMQQLRQCACVYVCVHTELPFCLLIPVTSPPCIVLAASSRFSPFSCLLPLIACAMAAMHRTIISTQSRIDNLDCSAIGQKERERESNVLAQTLSL